VSAAPGAVADKKERKKRAAPAMKAAKMDEAMPEESFEADIPAFEPPAARELDDTVPADPALVPRPRPAPERRAALVATPSPMALAMPLDGPTLTTTQALQPAGAFPTFSFKYKALPSENR
jgi:hypothetical protein